MKVISIGPDKDLLKAGSVSFERHQAYAEKVEELHAIIFARRSFGKEPVQIAKNAWAYPTHARTTFGLFWNAFCIGRKLLRSTSSVDCPDTMWYRARRLPTAPSPYVLSAQDPFESGIVAFALSRIYNIPLLLQEHGDFFSEPYWRKESFLNRVRYPIGLFLLRRAEHVRVVSERIKKTLIAKGVPKERISVAPVHTDVSAFAHAKPDQAIHTLKKEGELLVLSMARFVPQKNLSLLVRACMRACEEGVPLHLVLIGRGEEEKKLRNSISSNPPQYHPPSSETSARHGAVQGKSPAPCTPHPAPSLSISFLPWTDNPASALKSADIYALASNYEGWGRVCIEALASGIPLLTTDVGCVGDVVFHEKNALVARVGDEEVFAKNLIRLAKDSLLRACLVEEGKKTIEQLPTKEQAVENYIACLMQAILYVK